ncbi:11194_t:CDS:2 [Dentiscutata heterogama]|uniref:11194_t:CDS:1 n=1 Tax=Dentiscutata heterogama TaxID=1316150 RepID=A0ACA9JXT9_9GLOM|nr:11194_t:CDS:2 [Dentiscutata heterogama]
MTILCKSITGSKYMHQTANTNCHAMDQYSVYYDKKYLMHES